MLPYNLDTWILVGLQIATLVVIVYAGVKFLGTKEREWRAKEERLHKVESDLISVMADVRALSVRDPEVLNIAREIERLRSRLDRVLDVYVHKEDGK